MELCCSCNRRIVETGKLVKLLDFKRLLLPEIVLDGTGQPNKLLTTQIEEAIKYTTLEMYLENMERSIGEYMMVRDILSCFDRSKRVCSMFEVSGYPLYLSLDRGCKLPDSDQRGHNLNLWGDERMSLSGIPVWYRLLPLARMSFDRPLPNHL